MGLSRIVAPWRASILVGAVVAALLVSCESRSTNQAIVPRAVAPQIGPRTPAEMRWAGAVNALCARRNERLLRLRDRGLARYTSDALEIWDDYTRRAARLRAPASYRRRARELGNVEAALRAALVDVRKAARAKGRDVESAIQLFIDTTGASAAGFEYIGVPDCAKFQPYTNRRWP
jgi:hypothetical protein